MRYFALFLLFLIPFIVTYAQVAQEEYTIAELSWTQANFRIHNITATASIQVIDHDMNKFPNSTDTTKVFVFSDSYPEGITITLYETDFNSGIFERSFGLSEQRSAPNILYTHEGDTLTAKYIDSTLPPPHLPSDQLELKSTAFAGHSAPPLERVPVSSARIMDSQGNTIDRPAVGEQVHFTSDIANGYNREQKFTWLAQILDEQNKVVSLGWIDGILNPESSFSPSVSWIPEKVGQYSATMFVWESVDNPSALSPPLSIEFDVGPEELRSQRYGYNERFLFIVPQQDFEVHMDNKKLAGLHFYKIDKEELSQLPRLGLLINMTRDFTERPITDLKLRISDSQLHQYRQFFTQKCLDERPYAPPNSCGSADFAFEFDEKWYYVYNDFAPSKPTIEDSYPGWDEDYFKNG